MRRFGIIPAGIALAAVLSLGTIAFAQGGWGYQGHMAGPGYGQHMAGYADGHPMAWGGHVMAAGYGWGRHMDDTDYQDHMAPGWGHGPGYHHDLAQEMPCDTWDQDVSER